MSVLKINPFSKSRYSTCYYLGENPPAVSVLYKYLDMDAALHSIHDGTLKFVEPSEWKDQYEKRFYSADYSRITRTNLRTDKSPRLLASCFTRTKNDESAPLLYCYGKSGLGSICVRFQLSISGIRRELDSYAKKNGFVVYEGPVDYSLSENQLNTLHIRQKEEGGDNPYYKEYFSNFTLDSYLSLLLLKRPLFRHEMEHRFFLIPKNEEAINDMPCFVPFDWSRVVKSITIMKDHATFEQELLRQVCDKASVKAEIKVMDLYHNPDDRITIDANN